jgi:5-methylthioadenosine/S-adenosylhomocysteine deaminase
MMIEAVEPSNVDTVVVDGRILKRGGKFTALAPEQIIANAAATLVSVGQRVKPAAG